jgi:hypothetical protein
MALNLGDMASLTVVAAPQGHAYDTRSILFLSNPNDCLTSPYIEVIES